MKTRIDHTLLKKTLRTLPKHQRTFETPLKDLHRYVSTIVGPDLLAGELLISGYAFKPVKLNRLLTQRGSNEPAQSGLVIELENNSEIQQVLTACLAEWVDFMFHSTPKTIRLYADHDEYTTFYGSTKSNLNLAAKRLLDSRFTEIADYTRVL